MNHVIDVFCGRGNSLGQVLLLRLLKNDCISTVTLPVGMMMFGSEQLALAVRRLTLTPVRGGSVD